MKQSKEFTDMIRPIIQQMEKQNNKNPNGGFVKKLNNLSHEW
jgi:hypothetical protein